jgi:hypothetical protein
MYLGQVKISLSPVSPESSRFFWLGWHYWVPIHKQLDEATKENYEVEHPQKQRRRSHPLPNARIWTCQQYGMNWETQYRPQVSMLLIMENMFVMKSWNTGLTQFTFRIFNCPHTPTFILTYSYILHIWHKFYESDEYGARIKESKNMFWQIYHLAATHVQ